MGTLINYLLSAVDDSIDEIPAIGLHVNVNIDKLPAIHVDVNIDKLSAVSSGCEH